MNLYEAKMRLSDLVKRAAKGEDIVIAKIGRPRVRLVPVSERSSPRVFGRWAGAAVFQPGWDDDVTDDFEDL